MFPKNLKIWWVSLLAFSFTHLAQATNYTTGFEDASKGGYAAGTVTLNGIDWNFDDALIGTANNDQFFGAKSARVRGSGKLEMLIDKQGGAGLVKVFYAKFGTDNNSDWKLEYSINGGSSWTQAGSNITTSTTTLTEQSFNIGVSSNVRIRIVKLTGGNSVRLNFDSLSITDGVVVPTPVFNFSEASTSVSENAGSVSVTVAQGLAQTCNVNVVKTGGTAPANNFTFTSPTQVSFNGTATSQTITIPITNNVLLDGNRTIILSLQAADNGCTIGATAQITITITDDELPPVNGTTLYPGDIAIVAVNAADPAPNDRISFVNLVDILPNTEILFTDNGYERGNAANVATNTWGNAEGVIKLTYSGASTLPAGTINEFTNDVFNGPLNTAPANWTRTQVVPVVGTTSGNFNMSTTRDQLFVMQGEWNNGTFTGTVGNNDATFTGRVLFGYSNADWALITQAVKDANADLLSSRLPLQISCLNFASIALSETENSFKVNPNSLRIGNKAQIFSNLKNIANWQASYVTQTPFQVTTTGGTLGTWTGLNSSDWFNGCNWELYQVPDETVNVTIPSSAVNDPAVTNTGLVAKCKNIDIQAKTLSIKGNAAYTLEVHGDLLLSGGTLDMGAPAATADGTIKLYGNWTNNVASSNFIVGKGRVVFVGNRPQSINGSQDTEFANLQIMKSDSSLTLNRLVYVRTKLFLTDGIINTTTTNFLTLGAGVKYEGGSDTSHVNGQAGKVYISEGEFLLPVGKNGIFRPLGMTPTVVPGASNTNFVAEYFNDNPANIGLTGINAANGLCQVSSAEYWKIASTSATTNLQSRNIKVTGSWGAGSTPVINPGDMVMALWDTTSKLWNSLGRSDTSGTSLQGTVTSDLSFDLLGSDYKTITLGYGSNLALPTTSAAPTICAGTTAIITASSTITNPKFLWYASPSSTDILFEGVAFTTPTISTTTTYYVSVKEGNCQSARKAVRVTVRTLVPVFPKDTTITAGQSVVLEAAGGDSYQWVANASLSADNIANPVAKPAVTTTYTLTISNTTGCSETRNVVVTVKFNNDVFVPNSFSPNSDGNNDALEVYGNNIDNYELMIFNRLGNKVATLRKGETWNGEYEGKIQTGETLVWTLKGKYVDGSEIKKNGSVIVLK